MNHKLLIIVISGLTAVGGSFLFSENASRLEPQTANIIQTVATPTPSKTAVPKIKPPSNPQGAPLVSSVPISALSSSPSLITKTPALTPTPSPSLEPSANPSESPALSPSTTPISTHTPTPEPTPTPAPPGSPQHTFYTSSHWKAKYYYCDTDNGWKDLSPTYLKTFSSEAELLAAYPRVLHEPCKN